MPADEELGPPIEFPVDEPETTDQPLPEIEVEESPAPAPATVADVVPMPSRISRISQIIAIKNETQLLEEMSKFEASVWERTAPLRDLLHTDIHEAQTMMSIPQHMSAVERYREEVLRMLALMKGFVFHAKSDHFLVVEVTLKGEKKKPTEFIRDAYQRHMISGCAPMDVYLEGLVESIDSRVNMCKVILRLDEAGQYHPGAQKTA